MELSERKRRILRAVVESYIRSGEPVGSKALADDLGVSSATIRNEMSELAELGYLKQPHTSAGRVPTNEGYREYVANLMQRALLSVDEIAVLDSLMDAASEEFRELLEEGTRLLSHLTHYTAVSLAAREQSGSVKSLSCIYVNEQSFLLAVIFSDGKTRTCQQFTDFVIDRESLDQAQDICNARFAQKPVREIMKQLSSPAYGLKEPLILDVCNALYRILQEQKRYHVDVAGLSNLLQYPEFTDLPRTREVLGLLEQKDRLVRYLTRSHHGEISISIGSEDAPELDSTSMIVRTFHIGDDMIGALGIIGPKRMEYSTTLARLEYLARRIMPDQTTEESRKQENE